MTFTVSTDGQITVPPSDEYPVPDAEDRRRAKLLADGGHFGPNTEDLFARGIAVARSGGDVREFLRAQKK